MEKSGLCTAPGAHRLQETLGWVMAVSVLRPHQGVARAAGRWYTRAGCRGDLVRTGSD